MIEFKNVCKKYSNLKALDNINLTIPSSSIFGIVKEWSRKVHFA